MAKAKRNSGGSRLKQRAYRTVGNAKCGTGIPVRMVVVETRSGSGTTRRTVMRGGLAGGLLAVREKRGVCIPGIMRCTDSFYGRIERDIAEWRFREDLKLRVPYAVKRWKRQKTHELMRRWLLRGEVRRKGSR